MKKKNSSLHYFLNCFCSILDLYSSGPNFDEMLLLETELPDELMQGGPSSWEQQMVTNKPPAQGPGMCQFKILYVSIRCVIIVILYFN